MEMSRSQRRLLSQWHEGMSPTILLRKLYRWLTGKPEGEPIDPRLVALWDDTLREYAEHTIPRPIFRMMDQAIEDARPRVDEDIWDLRVDSDTRVAFLLGAGASAPSKIPTVDKLLPELWQRARKIGRQELDQLNEWCESNGITNIEDLMTAAYIANFAAREPNITALFDYFLFRSRRDAEEEEYGSARASARAPVTNVSAIAFLQDTLQTLFGLLASTMIVADPNPAHRAIAEFIRNHPKTSVITTNYDGCMDEAVLQTEGLTLKQTLGTSAPDSDGQQANGVELLRMHGSINWAYCESCENAKEFRLRDLKNGYRDDTHPFAVIGICNNCQGPRRPLLLPPLSFKFLMFPPLIQIWNTARERIDEAQYLIVVGYSFSDADTYITKIISGAMSSNQELQMIVVDPDPALVLRLRDRFSQRIQGFDEKRILRFCEGCETALPKLLPSMLGKATPADEVPAEEEAVTAS